VLRPHSKRWSGALARDGDKCERHGDAGQGEAIAEHQEGCAHDQAHDAGAVKPSVERQQCGDEQRYADGGDAC